MKKYPEHKNINQKKLTEDILNFWKKNNIFFKSIDNKSKSDVFNFYEGPPGANGMPGIHHVISRTLKDIFCRYKTLKGYRVERRAGWDTHGLPVEIAVEKKLGISKHDVGKKISVEDYNKECKTEVLKNKNIWEELTKKMGYWTDLENPYITYENNYIESVWSLLKKFYDKNLIYKGYNIQPFSPAAGTGLSAHELNMPGCYKIVKDTSIVAQFKIKDKDLYLLAWTTTPWTLPANSALAIGKNIKYVIIQTLNKYTFQKIEVILAKKAIPRYFNEKNKITKDQIINKSDFINKNNNIPWKIINDISAEEIIDIEYEQLMPYIKPKGNAFKVIYGDFVNTEDGTGIVHIAPTFGADDMKAAKKANISPIMGINESGKEVPIVDQQGKFIDNIKDFANLYVKDDYESEKVKNHVDYLSTDVKIAIKLKKENKAFNVEKYEHSYPHCWRTDKPILYYPMNSWFINTTKYKDKLINLNKSINWHPSSIGTGRFGNWLENIVDWNISRDRFWGIPLPIWKTKDENEEICIGSIKELKNEIQKSIEKGFMKKNIEDDFDLHKPYVDEIILVSPTGKKMFRQHEVIDVWFDSGAMPYAQMHYPFENITDFKKSFPADFIAEGVDQTRGWFFTLHTIAVMLFDSVAFKNVLVNGLVLDKKGNKMSKRLGNSINPITVIDEHGADILRWYMVSNANPWENLKFDMEELTKVQRRFFNTLKNTYDFFALYANIDNFEFSNNLDYKILTQDDKWIISRLNSLIKIVDEKLNQYDVVKPSRLIQDFVINDLSNWYVRLNRKRFWKSENNSDKIAAYKVLYTCLINIAKISSPFAPFYTEKLFNDLNNVSKIDSEESVHLCDFPAYQNILIDKQLEQKMYNAQVITSLVHSIRKNHKIKVRQPLNKILIPAKDNQQRKDIDDIKDIILNETNVKKIEFLDVSQNIISKKITPNYKLLGKKYGMHMKDIANAINNLSQREINNIEITDNYTLDINNNNLQSIIISKDDVIITSKDIPGLSVASHNDITVALDTNINKDLMYEGIAREFINRIQNIRKDMNLDIQDKINIYIHAQSSSIIEALKEHTKYICHETQTDLLKIIKQNDNDYININIDKENINIKIQKSIK